MSEYQYPVDQTINEVTVRFNGSDMNPFRVGPKHGMDREGWISDYSLWREGDAKATHRVNPVLSNFGYQVRLYAMAGNDVWEYDIRTGGHNSQNFFRAHNGGAWGGPYPVSELRIRLVDEAEEGAVEEIVRGVNDTVVFRHPGTTCWVYWNPATRQYVRVCKP